MSVTSDDKFIVGHSHNNFVPGRKFKHFADQSDKNLAVLDKNLNHFEHYLKDIMDTYDQITVSKDYKIIATSRGKLVQVLEYKSVYDRNTFEGHSSGVTSIVLSNDKKFVVSGGLDQSIRVWSLFDFNEKKYLKDAILR